MGRRKGTRRDGFVFICFRGDVNSTAQSVAENCTDCITNSANISINIALDSDLERNERASDVIRTTKEPAEAFGHSVVLDAAKKLHTHLRFLVNEHLGLTALQVGFLLHEFS